MATVKQTGAVGAPMPIYYRPTPVKRKRRGRRGRRVGLWAMFGRAAKRLPVCFRESWGLLRGMWRLDPKMRWPMALMVLFHVAIAALDTLMPLIMAISIDSFTPDTPYVTAAIYISTAFLVFRFPHGVFLELVRDVIAARYFRGRAFEYISGRFAAYRFGFSDVVVETKYGRQHIYASPASGEDAAILQQGRMNLRGLVESLLRDPIFAVRSTGILIYLAFTMPMLALLILPRLVVDLFVTFRMDDHLKDHYAYLQRRLNRLYAREMRYWGALPEGEERPRFTSAHMRRYMSYVWVLKWTEIRLSILRAVYENGVRDVTTNLFTLAGLLLTAWYVSQGIISRGDYLWFTSLGDKATEPMHIIFTLQRDLMEKRESLRLLGEKLNIDFLIRKII